MKSAEENEQKRKANSPPVWAFIANYSDPFAALEAALFAASA